MSLSLKYVSNVSLTLLMFFLTQKIEANLDRKCLELLRSNGHLSFPTGFKSNPKSAVSDTDSQPEDELVDAEEMEGDNPSDAASDEDIFQTPKRKSALKIPPPKKPRKLRRIASVNRKAATSAVVSDSDSFQEEEGVEHIEGERPSDAECGVDMCREDEAKTEDEETGATLRKKRMTGDFFVAMDEETLLPRRTWRDAAGFDIAPANDKPVDIAPHSMVKLSTRIKLASTFPADHYCHLKPRSFAYAMGFSIDGVVDRGPLQRAIRDDFIVLALSLSPLPRPQSPRGLGGTRYALGRDVKYAP